MVNRARRELTVYIGDVSGNDLQKLGGKGASLARLTGLGLNVPLGFILTTSAFDAYVKENDLSSTQSAEPELLRAAHLPECVKSAISRAVHKYNLEDKNLIVRSSATLEDTKISFAGQFLSVLNVRGVDEIGIAVKRVYDSAFSKKAVGYGEELAESEKVSMGVVVQEFVVGEVSGVMFTKDPLSNEGAVIEAVVGLNEGLVSGHVTPSRFILDDKNGIIKTEIAEQKFVVMPQKSGGTISIKQTAKVPDYISEAKIAELAGIGAKIEQSFGSPQDIEWTMHDNKFYILQSRPITSKLGPIEVREEIKGTPYLKGIPASPGMTSGQVRVVETADDEFKDGSILVAVTTETDFLPMMRKAKAFITEDGGMLSHAAIVARELGLPCIVNVPSATKLLKDGDPIIADGDKGNIYLTDGTSKRPVGSEIASDEYNEANLYCFDNIHRIDGKDIFYEVTAGNVYYYTLENFSADRIRAVLPEHLRGLNLLRGDEVKTYMNDGLQAYLLDSEMKRLYSRIIRDTSDLDPERLEALSGGITAFAKEQMARYNSIEPSNYTALLAKFRALERANISYLFLNSYVCEGYGLRTLYRAVQEPAKKAHMSLAEFLYKASKGIESFGAQGQSANEKDDLGRIVRFYNVLSRWREDSYPIFKQFDAAGEAFKELQNECVNKLNKLSGTERTYHEWFQEAIKVA